MDFMKKKIIAICAFIIILLICGCSKDENLTDDIAAQEPKPPVSTEEQNISVDSSAGNAFPAVNNINALDKKVIQKQSNSIERFIC